MRKQRTRIDDEPRDDKRTGEHDEQEGAEEERR